ncbi:MAG: helix-turn-helix domain-containing protein [Prevotella sp.]|nr:helix-turn-helix domain-containing protein [Prevotella sp.]
MHAKYRSIAARVPEYCSRSTRPQHRRIITKYYLTGKEVCERPYISPRTLQDYRDRRIIPYTQFAGKILYKVSDLEKMLEEGYKNF